MIALLISLSDFPDYVPFSVNIDASLVNPHIRTAQTMEVWPLLPLALRTELIAAVGEAEPSGEAGEFYGAEFYTPSASVLVALPDIFREHVRPLLVVESAREMMLWHGFHVTPAGLQTVSDPSVGAQPVSGASRAELRADLASKCTHYRGRLQTALRLAYPTAYPNTCAGTRRRPGSGGLQISAV